VREKYVTLRSGAPFHPPGAAPADRRANLQERIHVTVVVRSRCSEARAVASVQEIAAQLPRERKLLSPEEFKRLHGAAPGDLALVESFARDHGLRVVETSAARCCVVLSGSLAALGKAFRIRFAYYQDEQGVYRTHEGAIQLPADVAGGVEAVFGIDDRPLLGRHLAASTAQPLRRTDPREVARAYRFPARANGKGQRVAIIELGGGFRHSDLDAYFALRKLTKPRVAVRSIDGQKNNPSPPSLVRTVLKNLGLIDVKALAARSGPQAPARRQENEISADEAMWAMWTIETTMDIQLIGTVANRADVVVYFAPGTAHGQYHAFTAALHGSQNPSVISCSFGSCESELPPAFLRVMNRVFRTAALKGVTICFSSGDKGDDAKNGKPRVHFPASSPYVLACGGTHLDSSKKSRQETVWEEPDIPSLKSGGGVSGFFREPDWQSSAQVKKKTGRTGRGVPDVAGKADLKTGYGIVVGKNYVPMGGTSAAAPMWAGLVALLNQKLGTRVGYLTPLLYGRRLRGATRDILRGSNGQFYKAAPGWDPCTGWGSPKGTQLVAALKGKKSRG